MIERDEDDIHPITRVGHNLTENGFRANTIFSKIRVGLVVIRRGGILSLSVVFFSVMLR